jgi:hypothetical protein
MRSLVVAILISGSVAWAEEPGLPLTVGSRVRLQAAAAAEPLVGRVAAVDDQMLTLLPAGNEGAPVKIPRSSITAAEMSLGRRGHAHQGLAIGAIAGVGLAFAFPVDPVRCDEPSSSAFCSRGEALVGGIGAGLGLGALIGHLVKSDRWARVDVAGTVAVSRAGSGVRLVLRF